MVSSSSSLQLGRTSLRSVPLRFLCAASLRATPHSATTSSAAAATTTILSTSPVRAPPPLWRSRRSRLRPFSNFLTKNRAIHGLQSTAFQDLPRATTPATHDDGDDHAATLSSTTTTTTSDCEYTPYERWVRRLYMTNLFHPVKLGLSNIEQIHAALGSPMDDPRRAVVHVAGTNGKGSVVLKLAHTIRLARPNLKVGMFVSPHVSSFRERMQVNGRLISEAEVVELLPRIYDICTAHDIPATFFEITTALAFAFFAAQEVDVVVLETGLGGRLDSTNVVAKPALCIITSIGLEHTRILGDTKEAIAKEKGGIIKPHCPVLVGPNVPHGVLRECAREKQASEYYISDELLDEAAIMDKDDYDLENARIVEAAFQLLRKSHPNLLAGLTKELIDEGTKIRPPCRFEEVSSDPTVILDVAHNPPAMDYLVRKLQKTYPRRTVRVVVGMSSDKDLQLCGKSILQAVDGDATRIHVVEAAHPRAAKLEDILASFPNGTPNHDLTNRSVTQQVELARELAKQNNDVLVICGSVFMMAEAREALGFVEPRDSEYIAEVAGAGSRHGQENFGNTQKTTLPNR